MSSTRSTCTSPAFNTAQRAPARTRISSRDSADEKTQTLARPISKRISVCNLLILILLIPCAVPVVRSSEWQCSVLASLSGWAGDYDYLEGMWRVGGYRIASVWSIYEYPWSVSLSFSRTRLVIFGESKLWVLQRQIRPTPERTGESFTHSAFHHSIVLTHKIYIIIIKSSIIIIYI